MRGHIRQKRLRRDIDIPPGTPDVNCITDAAKRYSRLGGNSERHACVGMGRCR